jgi:transcriptional regulator with XRE-family HTH domain
MGQDKYMLLSAPQLEELWYAFKLRTFRKLTKAIRLSGCDQVEIARRINMDPGQLSRILSGERNVTIRTLFNIARAVDRRLDIQITDLAEMRESAGVNFQTFTRTGGAEAGSNVVAVNFSQARTGGAASPFSSMLAARS